ncbi:SWIM zinc finger family protein [Hibiscus syriacus]|uniref:SWIM zinc finger family protein n=1 Tax=Hibiscus syriacus TaxID=106335 RepID=A0A6A2X8Y7_HIBSY|nr:SWIM zinc finger family protein [Hibiscus syriacus]
MADETNTIQEKVQDESDDRRKKTNKRKLQKPNDRQEMWDWLLNSDDQNQEKVEEICSKPNIVKDDEIESLFNKSKRRKTLTEKDPQMLPLLTDYLSKKHLQPEFMDHGVLSLFKNWLEPLPDGSLPNATLRGSILNILTHVMPVDIRAEDRREHLKRSGLGKVIMFLSKSDEEITANRQLAKDLVENWSRTVFNKTSKYSEVEKVVIPLNKASPSPLKKKSAIEVREADLDLEIAPHEKSSSSGRGGGVAVPEAAALVYEVNPGTSSKAGVERGGVRNLKQRGRYCKRYMEIEKKMRKLKNSNKTARLLL